MERAASRSKLCIIFSCQNYGAKWLGSSLVAPPFGEARSQTAANEPEGWMKHLITAR